ncbi:hypothetical protein OBP_011 [Pseudomonas phage OBP]|uniref:hypothetical protein n=1 Tax=Pseudomonas phage OBP TaxID=1124849 RepID=UPI000240D608|nr:hypothetical protein OBP_011 [Pseudomonas phage OBP]AEV89448.1 hypothetical protein OBP_011 [Pseudomonas phage OBP]
MLLKLVSSNPTGEIANREKFFHITHNSVINRLTNMGEYGGKYADMPKNTIIVVEHGHGVQPTFICNDHEAYLISELGHTLQVFHRPVDKPSKKAYDPAVIFYSREIGEGDWYKCTFEEYVSNSKRAEMDTKYDLVK